jgi:hypothetical protein
VHLLVQLGMGSGVEQGSIGGRAVDCSTRVFSARRVEPVSSHQAATVSLDGDPRPSRASGVPGVWDAATRSGSGEHGSFLDATAMPAPKKAEASIE